MCTVSINYRHRLVKRTCLSVRQNVLANKFLLHLLLTQFSNPCLSLNSNGAVQTRLYELIGPIVVFSLHSSETVRRGKAHYLSLFYKSVPCFTQHIKAGEENFRLAVPMLYSRRPTTRSCRSGCLMF